jgi:hypothetical protein
VTYRYNDERRQEMERQGFLVRIVTVDKVTHEVTTIWYVYDPSSEEQREAAEQVEFEAYMAQQKAATNR